MPRAFIAIRVPCTPALEAALRSLRRIDGAVKPVHADALHLTLRFLGPVDDELMPRVAAALREAASGVVPFELSFRGVGAFPSPHRPATVWAGTSGDEPVHRIVQALAPRLDAIGFPGDGRAFQCHLTLAHVKAKPPRELAAFFDEHANTDFGRVPVQRADVMTSELRPDRAVHAVYETVELKS